MNKPDFYLAPGQISEDADGQGRLLGVNPGYQYENGKRTKTHIKYLMFFLTNNFVWKSRGRGWTKSLSWSLIGGVIENIME